MAEDTERQAVEETEPSAEMRAINERLLIAAVHHQERAEAAAETAESALRSGALYRLLAGNFPDGMVLLFDHDLRHILADGRGLAALGLSKEVLEGRTLWEGFTPHTCRQIEPAYRAALAGEATVLEVAFPDEASRREIGGRIYQVHTLPVPDEHGDIRTGMVVAQDVTERRQAEESVRWQAHHDALTGLPNRALLRDRLDQVLAMSTRSGDLAALLFLDLDHFKQINDTWGHATGDGLLKALAARLTGGLRAEDTVARLGGDEFVVLLPSLQAAGAAAEVAQKITALLSEPIQVEDHEISVNASIGVSLFPSDGRDAETLMRSADAAMYKSKEQHRG